MEWVILSLNRRENIQRTANLVSIIDRFTDFVGRSASWLTVALVIMIMVVVVTRYFLQVGSIALQESVTYLHATIFLLGIGFTLKEGGHVRVDILYRQFSPKRKALFDFCGGVFFLIPVSGLLFYTSWDYVLASWAIGETSTENNGLPFIYLLKTLMLLMPISLFLQGIAEIMRAVGILTSASYLEKGDNLKKAPRSHESQF